MRLPRLFGTWTAMALLTVSSAVASQAADPTLTADAVNRWIAELADDRAAARRAAEQALLAAGPTALELLPDPMEVSDAAARDALQRIRRELERMSAEAAVLPSRITFAGTTSLAELVAEIERQTGNPLRLDAGVDAQRRLSVNWRAATFWQAVIELIAIGGLDIEDDQTPGLLRLSPKATSPAKGRLSLISTDSESAYWIRVAPIESPHLKSSRNGLTSVRVVVRAEPRLRPLFLTVRDADFELQTAQQVWTQFNPLASREIEFAAAGFAAFDIPYQCDLQGGLDGLLASGRFVVELIGRVEELHFTGLEGRLPIVRRRGDATASLDTLRDSGAESVAAQLTLRYAAGGPAFESHRVAALFRDARLELPGGERIPAEPVAEFTREQNGALGATYRFPVPPPTWRQGTLVYAAPTVLTRQVVTFESSFAAEPAEPMPPGVDGR